MPAGPLLCLDTASLYYRSFYALPEKMTAPDGHPHNAIRGLLTTMTRLVQARHPRAIAACWDVDWRPDWRVALLPSYKTHRLAEESSAASGAEEAPDSLGRQVEAIAAIIDALGIPRPGAPGFEADDVIATLARSEPTPVIAVTGDRDLVQVVRPGVSVLLTVNGGMEKWPLLDSELVLERFGVRPDQYVDLAVLRGDPSDGIPGVPGFGAKTAAAVLAAFGSLDALTDAAVRGAYERPLTARLAGLLLEHQALITSMRQAATARTDAPVAAPVSLVGIRCDESRLSDLCMTWGVSRFVDELREAIRSLDR